MRDKISLKTKIALIIITIIVISAAGYCLVTNPKQFLELSLTSIINWAIAIFVSFLLVQRQTDRRNQKEAIIRILSCIQQLVNDPAAWEIADEPYQAELTMRKRKISNLINILEEESKAFNIGKDVIFIKDKFTEYADFMGNHISDLDYLKRSKLELQRPLDLIYCKIFETQMTLYR